MAKRKRVRHKDETENSRKKKKVVENSTETCNINQVEHPVLSRYYPQVLSLRQFVRIQLLSTSKRRLRIFDNLQRNNNDDKNLAKTFPAACASTGFGECRAILETFLVGQCTPQDQPTAESEAARLKEYDSYSQQMCLSGSAGKTQLGSQHVSLAEVIDFSIWLLFNRRYPTHHRPPHVLCHGFVRSSTTWQNRETGPPCSIPGLIQISENEHVKRFKEPAWERLFNLLGQNRDRIMIHLLTNCGLFTSVQTSAGCFYQTSGHLLSDLKPRAKQDIDTELDAKEVDNKKKALGISKPRPEQHKHSDIRFVRNRMLYARAALNTKGDVAFGLRHIHVLNRYSDPTNDLHTTRVMMYMFPRQFKLHNVFTSKTDPKETAQQFQDYTLREREIAKQGLMQNIKTTGKSWERSKLHLPKRLRGKIFELVKSLQKRHIRCSYTKLLEYYCPPIEARVDLAISTTQPAQSFTENASFRQLATPTTQVSAFCRATISRVFPLSLIGGIDNMKVLHKCVDLFIKHRRFESPTLSFVMAGLKIKNIEWLQPPSFDSSNNLSLTDYNKRYEIMAELVYYIFDSFLVPLIRTNFHVTESGVDRNRLYYFRHDIWRRLTEPALNSFKLSMFDEIGGEKSLQAIQKQTLGYSQLRLLPKEKGMRPILNLRRRPLVKSNGLSTLGRSINSVLGPAFHVLNYEKNAQPGRLGSSLFSVAGLYQNLANFRERVVARGSTAKPKFFFAKVDVKGCFDSIPQKKLMQLTQELLSCDEYNIAQLTEIRRSEFSKWSAKGEVNNPTKRYSAIAHSMSSADKTFDQLLLQKHRSKPDRPNTVYVDSAVHQCLSKTRIAKLLEQHIKGNIVKIGKKYFRQNRGIPQGSVVSSLLCNFFYGDLEQADLKFLKEGESVLFRLIDDFLLISTDKQHALRFLEVMHSGIPSYGITIKKEKSLVNFKAEIGGILIPRMLDTQHGFPYCGMIIDCQTLDVRKDLANSKMGRPADTLTVEYARHPGYAFSRKVMAVVQLQMHTMLLDTAHNSRRTVLENVFLVMIEASIKSYEYIKCLGKSQKPSSWTLKKLIEDLHRFAFAMMKSWRNKLRHPGYRCNVSKTVTAWLTLRAFLYTFGAKQSRFVQFLPWLKTHLAIFTKECGHEVTQLEAIARNSWRRRSRAEL